MKTKNMQMIGNNLIIKNRERFMDMKDQTEKTKGKNAKDCSHFRMNCMVNNKVAALRVKQRRAKTSGLKD